jgi:hypothetical protein
VIARIFPAGGRQRETFGGQEKEFSNHLAKKERPDLLSFDLASRDAQFAVLACLVGRSGY